MSLFQDFFLDRYMKLYLSQLITLPHIKQEIWELAFEDTSVPLPLTSVAEPRKEGRRQVSEPAQPAFRTLDRDTPCHPGRLFPTGPTAAGLGVPGAGWRGETEL